MTKSSSLRVLVALVGRARGAFALLLVVALLLSALEAARLAALYLLVSAAVGESAAGGGILRVLEDWLAPFGARFAISLALFGIAECAFAAVTYLHLLLVQGTALRLQEGLHRDLLDRFLDAPYLELVERRHGDTMYRVMSAPALLGSLFTSLPQLVTKCLKGLVIAALLFSVSVPITLGVLVVAGVLALGGELLGRRLSYDWGHAKQRARQRQDQLVNEALDGIRDLKVYGRLDQWSEEFHHACGDLSSMIQKLFLMGRVPPHIFAVVTAALVAGGAILIRVTLGERLVEFLPLIALFAVAVRRLFPLVGSLGQMRLQIAEKLPVAELIDEELQRPASLEKREHSEDAPDVEEGVRFERVSLEYREGTRVLDRVTLTVRAGETTALVGPSGAGKSSVVNLLLRMFDPTEGRILVDGVPLDRVSLSGWRRKIGFVGQEAFLLYGTVAENIAFGREASAEEIERAARLADAHDFIQRLPEGYDTPVGEQGMRFSGGQRQRICIARAVLKQPELLILDEATSSLDSRSEAEVQRAIEKVTSGRTVITVAHSLSTVRGADRIVVLEDGRVAQSGDHQELVACEGLYRDLHFPGSGEDDAATDLPA